MIAGVTKQNSADALLGLFRCQFRKEFDFTDLISLFLFTQPCRLAATAEAGEMHWKFYFKLYCFLDTENVPKDSVEFAFMFEQVKDKGSVLRHFSEEEKSKRSRQHRDSFDYASV